MTSYVTWANKGGIGKSTLSFQLALKYARLNTNKKVIIIDMTLSVMSLECYWGEGILTVSKRSWIE